MRCLSSRFGIETDYEEMLVLGQKYCEWTVHKGLIFDSQQWKGQNAWANHKRIDNQWPVNVSAKPKLYQSSTKDIDLWSWRDERVMSESMGRFLCPAGGI